jgi:hypothetical protein
MKRIIAALLMLTLSTNLWALEEPWKRKWRTLERIQPQRLQAAHADAQRLQAARQLVSLSTGLNDYKCILHAHAQDSAHTGGTRPEMLADAKRANVHAILLTDHFRPPHDFINDSWRGLHEGVLFIPGSENRGYLLYPTSSIMKQMDEPEEAFIKTVTADDGMIFLSHLEERPEASLVGLTGMEIYNRHADAKDDMTALYGVIGMMLDPKKLAVLEDSLNKYPAEVLAFQLDYMDLYMHKFDEWAQKQHVTGVAANDCHHNQVFLAKMVDDNTVIVGTIVDDDDEMQTITSKQVKTIPELTKGHAPGDVLARLDFDPYYQSFYNESTHVLANELTEASIRDALHRGRAYVSHDWMCDPTGFAFGVRDPKHEGKLAAVMGDEYPASGVALVAEFPVKAYYRLFKDGRVVETGETRTVSYSPDGPGTYRIEGWLEVDQERRPWIYSNHVYLK